MSATLAERLILTPGDPHGIGPEVVTKVLAERPDLNAVVVGDREALVRAAALSGLKLDDVEVVDPGDTPEPVEVGALRWGVDRILAGQAGALVTGPIHKNRLAARGFKHPGHTGFLAELCGVTDPVMAFVGGSVRVALVTVHLPLRAVPDAVTRAAVGHTIRVADVALRDQLGLTQRRIAVCGLNPHAGDGGLLGTEDRDQIAPAVAQARDEGIDARGPLSAEAAFRLAVAQEVELVVAMYHDQGLAPLKALDFGRSVNWTLGLPIIRTSVDHGTADDIVGQGIADAGSLHAAVRLAETLIHRRAV